MYKDRRRCYLLNLTLLTAIIVVATTAIVIMYITGPENPLKPVVVMILIAALSLVVYWIPVEAAVLNNAVVLRGALRRKVVEGDVVETYTHDEVVRYLSFVPIGNRASLRCFFWGVAGSFQRRNGEWVGVDVFAGRNCGDRWLLVKIKGREKYLLVCVDKT
ncbi:hypothetical protein [Pyrobaculum ferrireducens]|uniref:Bacterial Pleckstrin homology domain-containing protein n=1 Tax=Pyrobaculum ferrireducens TaxID=1104324 RepID=G7VE15_9CREN|nr:hypothetical protein [Pyrobaculum ferrireducens]AET32788.1 hypothetical protein P186_1360 [Pyrobaculum ferrireducens]